MAYLLECSMLCENSNCISILLNEVWTLVCLTPARERLCYLLCLFTVGEIQMLQRYPPKEKGVFILPSVTIVIMIIFKIVFNAIDFLSLLF